MKHPAQVQLPASRDQAHWKGTRPFKIVVVAATLGLLATACGGGSGDEGTSAGATQDTTAADTADDAAPAIEETTYTVASFTAPDAPEEIALGWWADQIEERTGGAVTFEHFPQESLCTGAEITECVRDGRADFGMTVTGYTPDKFPITEIWSVPFLSSDVQAVTQAHMALYEESEAYQQEMEAAGLVPFVLFPSDRALLNVNEPVTDHTQLQGKSMRAVGLVAEALGAVGADPVAVTASEVYEAAQRGVVDGFIMNIAGNASYSLYEVASHSYDPGIGVYAGLGLFASTSVVEDMQPEVREIVDEVTQEWIDGGKGIELITEAQQASCDKILEADSLEVWEAWSDEAVQDFKAAVGDGPKNAWIQTVESAGVEDGAALFSRYEELLAKFETDREYIVDQCAAQVE